MVTFILLRLPLFLFFCSLIYSQSWIETAAPGGGGITDLIVRSDGTLLATTGSYDWPAVDGGVRKSTDGGLTWQNTADAFNARTIEEAFNGDLYASIWFYPQAEGLYHSTDGGNNWTGPLYSTIPPNNIFSIAVKPAATGSWVFIGTRNGVLRSMNGGSFTTVNNGIPANSWVRDLEIDSSGVIAAATTNGIYVSTDNGSTWLNAVGVPTADTTVTLAFEYPFESLENDHSRIYGGTSDAGIYRAFQTNTYLTYTLLTIFDGSSELAGFWIYALRSLNLQMHGVATFGNGVFTSTNPEQGYIQINEGLPENAKASAISGRVLSRDGADENIEMYVGLYENTSAGARVFKRNITITGVEDNIEPPNAYSLEQNYPNPFNPTTNINYSVTEFSKVELRIFDVLGNEIDVLVNEEKPAGKYEVKWFAEGLPSGIYFCSFKAGDFTKTNKMVLIR